MQEKIENCDSGDAAVATIERMGKRKAQQPQDGDETAKKQSTLIRVEADLAYMLAVIAAIEGVNVSDIASPCLRTFVEKRYAEALKKAADRSK